jgi:hypothetical protein
MESVRVECLDHVGVIAAVIKDLGIIDRLDARLVPDRQEEIMPGAAVAGMMLNGFGFANRPLSLTPQFFAHTPLVWLLHEGIHAEMFNRLHSAVHAMKSIPMAVIGCCVTLPWPSVARKASTCAAIISTRPAFP